MILSKQNSQTEQAEELSKFCLVSSMKFRLVGHVIS